MVHLARTRRLADAECQLLTMIDALDSAASQLESLRDRSLVAIHKEENQKVIINQLPVEILGKIFLDVVGDQSLSTVRPSLPPRDPTNRFTFDLISVCSHWKRVVDAMPFLWATIVVKRRSQQANLRALALAGRSAPLNLFIEEFGSDDSELLEELYSRCGQFSRFHLAATGHSEHSKLERFNTEAPLLTSLCVLAIEDDYALPQLFAGRMPALKYLALGSLTRFSSNDFNNLTHLRFFRNRYRRTCDFLSMLVVLQRSPTLEEYVMEDSDTYGIDVDDDEDVKKAFPNHSIALPQIAHLSFKSCGVAMASTIMRLLCLPNPRLALNLTVSAPRELEYLLLSQLRSYWQPLQQTFTALRLSFDPDAIAVANQTCAVRLREPLDSGAAIRDCFYRPRQLFHHANLQSLSLLSDPCSAPGTTCLWRDIFANLTSLTTLFLRLRTENNYIMWLEALTTREEGFSPGPYPAPALRNLCLTPPNSVSDDPDLFTFLVMDRHRSGHPLQTLRVVCEHMKRVDNEEIHDIFMFWKSQSNECERYVHEVRFEEHTGQMLDPGIPAEFNDWAWASTLGVP